MINYQKLAIFLSKQCSNFGQSSETSETSEISDIFRMYFGNNTPSVLNAAIWLALSPCTFPVLYVRLHENMKENSYFL